jgi:nucleotide-binding universal stress UspA family protein
MKKILVPCDFSEQAIQAFRFALDIARETKGSVHLVHVVELPVIHDPVFMPVMSFEEALINEFRESAEKQFQKLQSKYAGPEHHYSANRY